MQSFAPARLLLETIIWNAIQLPLAAVAGAWVYSHAAWKQDAARRWSGETQAAP